MKRLVSVFLSAMCCTIAAAQKKTIKGDEMLFEKALLLHELANQDLRLDEIIHPKDSADVDAEHAEYAADTKETILDKAHQYYEDLLDEYPKSKLRFRALNNKAFIELELEDPQAKETFVEILESKADDRERGGIGSGIMGEPFANYKNRAAKTLAGLYIEEKNYVEALKYLELTKKYKYQHFCGNEYASETIYMSKMYAKCYLGLQDYKNAYAVLLPHISPNGLADNSELVEMTYDALLKNYKREELRTLFDDALKNYKTEIVDKGENTHERYYMIFLDTEIDLEYWDVDYSNAETRLRDFERKHKESPFYKLLNQ